MHLKYIVIFQLGDSRFGQIPEWLSRFGQMVDGHPHFAKHQRMMHRFGQCATQNYPPPPRPPPVMISEQYLSTESTPIYEVWLLQYTV